MQPADVLTAPKLSRKPTHATAPGIVFKTDLGWMGVAWSTEGLIHVRMGYPSSSKAKEALKAAADAAPPPTIADLMARLQAFAAGAVDDFRDVPVAPLWNTPFQRDVVTALRTVGYGQTTSYAELAHRAGRPGAARAVGQVMASNPVPLVVPCHRVLASGGGLGGFSAPSGTSLKQRLLDLEAEGLSTVAAARKNQ